MAAKRERERERERAREREREKRWRDGEMERGREGERERGREGEERGVDGCPSPLPFRRRDKTSIFERFTDENGVRVHRRWRWRNREWVYSKDTLARIEAWVVEAAAARAVTLRMLRAKDVASRRDAPGRPGASDSYTMNGGVRVCRSWRRVLGRWVYTEGSLRRIEAERLRWKTLPCERSGALFEEAVNVLLQNEQLTFRLLTPKDLANLARTSKACRDGVRGGAVHADSP
jgi:hypothetical protein